MSYLTQNDIYFHTQINRRVSLNPRFLDLDFSVACKTGTAEFGDPQERTHAWFTVFAPADDPEISITVLVEAGGGGSEIAAPIAKEIMEEWVNKLKI